jgi:hypothetical protein
MIEDARWVANIYYRTDNGTVVIKRWLEELCEIDDLVEAGPHWDTIEEIKIERINHLTSADLTVEAAAKLLLGE